MVMIVEIIDYDIGKVLVDQKSSTNSLYWKTFQEMKYPKTSLYLTMSRKYAFLANWYIPKDILTCERELDLVASYIF